MKRQHKKDNLIGIKVNIEEEKRRNIMRKIYLLEQSVNTGYDTYDSMEIIAVNLEKKYRSERND